MASIFKPVTIAYRTPEGKKCSKNSPGATKLRILAKVWYGRYKDASRKRVTVPLCSDKTASKQMLAKLVTDAKLAQHGLGDVFEEHRKRPLAEHLEDYRRNLLAKGNTPEHTARSCARAKAIIEGCKFVWLTDLAATVVADYLHELRRDPPRPTLPQGQELFTGKELRQALGGGCVNIHRLIRREKLETKGNGKMRQYPRVTVEALQDMVCRGLGMATSNAYLVAMKGFTRWLVRHRRAPSDPMALLSRLNAKTDIRHGRRALPVDELKCLLSAAEGNSPEFLGLSGPERSMLYALAMVTGFRASELASLITRSFDLDSIPATARVQAAYTKNRREAIQPLPPAIVGPIGTFLASRPVDGLLWPGNWAQKAAEMLRGDLDAAGIPYRDEAGRVADFHALRHSYITLLAKSGAHPKLVQELARHSDIRLTMDRYSHMGLLDLAGAVENLPALLPSPKKDKLAATGTDGKADLVRTRFVHSDAESCGTMRIAAETDGTVTPACHQPEAPVLPWVAGDCGPMRATEEKLPGMDSNHDKEIQSLLCYRYTTG